MQNNSENNDVFNLGFIKLKKFSNLTKKVKLVLVVVLAVAVLIIFSSSFNDKKRTKTVEQTQTLGLLEYCETQENRLEYVLGQIKGIENVKVFLMTDASPTIKYLEETKTENASKDQNSTVVTETKIVMSKNGSISTPVVVVEMYPKITGVLVVAKGAGNVKVKANLINTISAILNVKVSCIEVLEGK